MISILRGSKGEAGRRIMMRNGRNRRHYCSRRRLQLINILILGISVYIFSVQSVDGRPHNSSNSTSSSSSGSNTTTSGRYNNYSHHQYTDGGDPFLISYRSYQMNIKSSNNNDDNNNNNYDRNNLTLLSNNNNIHNKNTNNQDDHSDLMGELKEKILQDLGFDEIPSRQGLAAISKEEYLRAYTEYMFNVRNRREGQRGEPNNAKHRRKHAEIFLESIEPLKQQESSTTETTTTTRVMVTFHLQRPRQVDTEEERIQVRQATLWIPQGCQIEASHQRVDPEEIMYEDSLWGMDVTKNVSRWLAKSLTPSQVPELTFSLNCSNSSSGENGTRLEIVWRKTEKKRRVRRSAGRRWQFKVSDFADGKSEIKEKKLGKRRAKDCEEIKHGRKSCCRKSLEVSFAELEIKDFILAPTKFDMDYCEGRCSARRLPYASNHAIFQHIMLKNGRGAKLCCSPTKLSEVDVVQRDPLRLEQLKVTVIHNAKVEECGCS